MPGSRAVGPYTDNTGVGGDGGQGFVLCAKIGALVKTIGAWKHADGIQSLTGIHFDYTDGTHAEAGGKTGTYQEFTFLPGEYVSKMSLWGNGVGTRTGRIQFSTNRNNTFDFGQDTGRQTEFPMDVGSGYFVGCGGSAGDEIDMLIPTFLASGATVTIDNVNYVDDVSSIANKSLNLISLQEESYPWNGSPYNYSFTGSRMESTTTTWGEMKSTSRLRL